MGVHILGVSLVCLALHLVSRLLWKRSTPLPPGPPGWPLIGNLLDFPTNAPYKTFAAMSSKYGPIISLRAIGTRYIVLNSLKAAKDLIENKSAITSNRPHLTMAGDLVGWNNLMVLLQYSDTYRKHRKFLHRLIGAKSSLEAFYPIEEAEAKQFVRNVMKTPDNLIAHTRRTASSIILKISHGYTLKEDGDPLAEMANKAMRIFSTVTMPGRFLVDTLPILRYWPEWLPGGGFHRDARQWRKMVCETADTLHQLALAQEGVAPEKEEISKWGSSAMYIGGSDTSASALSAFFLAITIYPELLKKAQAEVDAVTGNKRLPTVHDRDALPYVNAICKELLRWNVLIPMPPHVTTQDIMYEGYLIPQGTQLLPNIWFILSNPEIYPDPDVFDPERFLGDNQQPDPREACFGWGRRQCPGGHLGELTIFMCVTMALATLDVSRYVENGVEQVPKYDFEEDMIRHVKPFKCRVVPRSKKAEELLRA